MHDTDNHHTLSIFRSVFPMGGMPQHAAGFPNIPGAGGVGGDGAAAEGRKVTPDLSLSTLEFYLFSFAWYALSSCGDFYAGLGGPGRLPPHQYHSGVGGGWTSVNFRPERVALGWRRYGVKGLTHRNPYMTLLKDYAEAFFPHGGGGGSASWWVGGYASGMSAQSELFLRVLVEFWLEGNTVLRPGVLKESYQTPELQQPRGWGSGSAGAGAAGVTAVAHPAPTFHRTTADYDPSAALLASDFTAPTDMSLHGLLLLSAHLLADPLLPEACRQRLHQPAAGGGGLPSSSATTGRGGGAGSALTPALELLRPHVFGFLRVAFSSESTMHTSSAAFSLAVELWLLWMRPWAAPAIARG
ncbi:unnamed protein product, partial [Laminaria digitata]